MNHSAGLGFTTGSSGSALVRLSCASGRHRRLCAEVCPASKLLRSGASRGLLTPAFQDWFARSWHVPFERDTGGNVSFSCSRLLLSA